jgi:hypothetical protein
MSARALCDAHQEPEEKFSVCVTNVTVLKYRTTYFSSEIVKDPVEIERQRALRGQLEHI